MGWIGFLTVLYMEVKAVSVTRERDERRFGFGVGV